MPLFLGFLVDTEERLKEDIPDQELVQSSRVGRHAGAEVALAAATSRRRYLTANLRAAK